jgi:hypothetical protein
MGREGYLLGGTVLVGVFSYLWWSGFFIPKYQLNVYVKRGIGFAGKCPGAN